MRPIIPISALALALALPALSQDEGPSPTEKLKDSVREWIETMREVQKEETDWERDEEVLRHYREGLDHEIRALKEQIAKAELEKAGAEKESLDEVSQRDAFVEAKKSMVATVRELEEGLVGRLPGLPRPLLEEPRVAGMVDSLRKDVQLTGREAEGNIAKRLSNVLNILSEAEKFQQKVVLRDELHESADGREFNMKVVYFGLGTAYAVNETGDFALRGHPTTEGWKFEAANELAAKIQTMVGVTTGDVDAAFITLPFDLQ